MPRRPRICPAGTCFHVINRAVVRLTLFEKKGDYEAFERVLGLALERVGLPVFSYIVITTTGHLYQGRIKTFPIGEDEHLLAVLRYVERNVLRASLGEASEDWKYGSLRRTTLGDCDESRELLAPRPIPRPRTWKAMVNRAQNEAEVKAIQKCLRKGQPFGSEGCITQSAVRLHLEHTLRKRGRPKKQ